MNFSTASIINATASITTLSNFLKFTPVNQFVLLDEVQVDLLEAAIDGAYFNTDLDQRPRINA
jgi:hypothetical protein